MSSTEELEKSNVLRIYYAMDTQMMTAHRTETVEGRADAERTARILLSYSDLPLLIRARACMVIGCGESHDFLEQAKEGVRIAELGIKHSSLVGDVENQLLADCKTVQDEAQKAFDEAGGHRMLEGEEAEEGADGEVVWQAEEPDITGEATVAAEVESAGKKKKVRRIHSGDTGDDETWEEFDKAVGGWVALGTAIEPEFVDEDAV